MEKLNFAFVHGGGQAGWVWDECIAALRAEGGEKVGVTLALDAPGCGAKRGRMTGGLAMAEVVEEFLAEIEATGAEKFVLVGHSQAGQALPLMARARPELFRRLVYVTCSAPLPGQSVMQMMGTGLRGNPAEVGWPLDPAVSTQAERFAITFCNDMASDQASDFLSKLGADNWPALTYSETGWHYDGLGVVPASYVKCLRDEALPASWQDEFALRLGIGSMVTVDAGHQAMNTQSAVLARLLIAEAER